MPLKSLVFAPVSAPRTVNYVVAASDASASVKAQADYVCDGVGGAHYLHDDYYIQAAINALPTNGGDIGLFGNTFYCANQVMLPNKGILIHGDVLSYTNVIFAAGQNGFVIGGVYDNQTYLFRDMAVLSTGLTKSAIEFLGDSTHRSRVNVDNISFSGWSAGIHLLYGQEGYISHCMFYNNTNGIVLEKTVNYRIESNKSNQNISSFVSLYDSGWESGSDEGIIIIGNVSYKDPYNIQIYAYYYVSIIGNILDGGTGFTLQRIYADANSREIIVKGNIITNTDTTNPLVQFEPAVTGQVEGNHIDLKGVIAPGAIVRSNEPFVTENSGTATVVSGSTSIAVNHGLATTPTRVYISLTNNPTNDPQVCWVDTLGVAQFTIHTKVDPGATGAIFNWRAQVGEG